MWEKILEKYINHLTLPTTLIAIIAKPEGETVGTLMHVLCWVFSSFNVCARHCFKRFLIKKVCALEHFFIWRGFEVICHYVIFMSKPRRVQLLVLTITLNQVNRRNFVQFSVHLSSWATDAKIVLNGLEHTRITWRIRIPEIYAHFIYVIIVMKMSAFNVHTKVLI